MKPGRALVFSALGRGSGCALRARYLCEALRRRGWNAELVLPGLRNRALSLESFLSLPRFAWKALWHRADLAVGIKPYPNCWLALAIARARGAVAVADIDDWDGAWRKGLAGRLAAAVQAPAFLLLKDFSTHHPGIREKLAGRGRVFELGQGVDTGTFNSAAARLRAEKLLLFTAHLNVACQLDLLLQCVGPWLASRADWSLVVAGGGPLLAHFRSRHESPQVKFTGDLEASQVAAWIRKSRICLAAFGSSEGNAYRVPMKCGEYLAMSKPVISNDIAGLAPLRRFLYLCEAEAASFSKQLTRLAQGRGDGREKRGAAWVRSRLSWDRVAARFLDELP